ncbi:hypothetical protein EJ03DRAFT_38033 [Teratosphaeria nubilosa]|uniref:Apple domain-containing protein n=1 Tax=Teratosphaeria nubilosa TaxID=161662 RepID=A0A6G1LEJ5_9PEZI|nr:hypothetical protein EJ03DRAFT_38033 [Teratosphaeria nubilosa]
MKTEHYLLMGNMDEVALAGSINQPAQPQRHLYPYSPPSTSSSTSTSSYAMRSSSTVGSIASSISTAITCQRALPSASVASSCFVGSATTVNTVALCGPNCLDNAECESFIYTPATFIIKWQ